MRHTPEHITELAENEIFCFGSNTHGIHGSGAALHAWKYFGAIRGVGEGLFGNSYAFPTLNADSRGGLVLEKRSHEELAESVRAFFQVASYNPGMVFLLTRVGCGLAGYSEDYMKSLFIGSPPNVVKPEGW